MQSKELENISFCPKCSSYRIRTELITTRVLVGDDCDLHRNEWLGSNYPCTCVYEERVVLNILCFYCLEKDRQRELEEEKDRQREEETKLSYKKWTTSTPQEKLTFYGMNKLKILARRKGIAKLYKLTRKQQVIDALKPLVSESDFPIRTD